MGVGVYIPFARQYEAPSLSQTFFCILGTSPLSSCRAGPSPSRGKFCHLQSSRLPQSADLVRKLKAMVNSVGKINVDIFTFASKFVDQFAFPEQHYMLLVFHCFFLLKKDKN